MEGWTLTMKRLIALFIFLAALAGFFLFLMSTNVQAQDEDLEGLLGEDPPVLEPVSPYKLKNQNKPKDLISVDDYCLCKCIKKGQNPNKSKPFKARKTNHSCLCECLV